MSESIIKRALGTWSSAPDMLDFPLPSVLHDGRVLLAVNRQGELDLGLTQRDVGRLSWQHLVELHADCYEIYSVDLHDVPGDPLSVAVFHAAKPDLNEPVRCDGLLEAVPMCGLELEVGECGAQGSYRPSRILNANQAALALFEAQSLRQLRLHLETQLRQPGVRVCVESALTPPYQPREGFGLRMVTTAGSDLLVRATFMRLTAVDPTKPRIVVFMEDVASFEGLRLNFDACRRRLADLVRVRDEQVELVRSALMSRDRLADVLLEVRSAHTAAHMRRVAVLSEHIGLRLGMGRPELAQLITAARLHDIGIVQVPVEMLARSGQVSAAERRLIEEHPANAQKILAAAGYGAAILSAVGQHHERFDGSGYPGGLVGADICPAARVLGVADVMDAMLASRPYRDALRPKTALNSLQRKSSGFDPDVLAACHDVFVSRESLTPRMGDEERAAMCAPLLTVSADAV